MKLRILSASRSFFPTIMTLAGLALAVPSASASDGTWDGGYATTSTWSNNVNWVGDVTPTFNSTSIITFYAVGAARLTNNYIGAARTIGSLIFNDDADGTVAIKLSTSSTSASGNNANLTIGGAGAPGSITIAAGAAGSFTLGASGDALDGNIILANNLTVTHNGSGTLTLSRPVTGAFSLTKSGTGKLILSGANTYSTGTIISGGTLALTGAGGTAGVLADAGSVNINNAAGTFDISAITTSETIGSLTGVASSKVVLGGKNLTVGATTSTYAGDISGTLGSLTKYGAGTLTLSSADSSYTGATTISGGILEVSVLANGGSNSSIGSSAATGTNLVFLGGSSFGILRYIGDVDVVTDRAFQYSSGSGGGATIESSGLGTFSFDTSGTGITNSTLGEIRSLVLGGTNTGANTFGKIIANNGSGATSLTKTGVGTWILNQSNTFTGATTISAGTLTLNNSLALQNSALDTTNSIAGTANAGLNTSVTTLTFGGLTGNKDLASVFTTTSGGYSGITTLTLKRGAGSNIYSGAITEGAVNMNLTKTGAGTQTLSGANTYTGITTVNQGILTLENDQSAATGGFNVGSTTASANPILNIGSGATTTVSVTSGKAFQIGTNATNGIDAVVNVADLATVTNAGSLTIGRRGVLNVNSGATWNQSGDLIVQGWGNVDTSIQGKATLTVSSGGIFNYTGVNTIKLPVAGGGGTYSGSNPGIVIQGDFSTGMGFESDQTQTGTTTNGLTIDGGTLKFTASVADITTATGSGAAYPILVTLTNAAKVDTQANNVGSSNIGGTGSLTKLGDGTLSLSGPNSYTGTTSITAGTLKINGNQSAATGAVTVAANATLTGSGIVGGATSFAVDPDGAGPLVGGIHSAGDGVGKQSFTSTVNYGAGSIFAWELGSTPAETTITKDGNGFVTATNRGTAYDAVNVAGALSGADAVFRVVLSGSQTFADTFWNTDRQWTDIFRSADQALGQAETASTNIASIFGGGFQYYNSTGAIGNTSTGGSFSVTGSTLTWSAVPEPTSALAGLLLGAGLLRRRRAA